MTLFRKPWVYPALIALVGGLVYAGSLRNDFTFDDWPLVAHNPLVLRFDPGAVFSAPYWVRHPEYGLYRPLTTLSYAVNRMVFGEGPAGFHAVNVMLHIANALLVFAMARAVLNRVGAGVCALVFLLHPVQTEAVNSIVGRAELLAAFWMLVGLAAYGYCRGWGRWVWPALALGLGCLCKEHAATLMGLFVAVDVFGVRRGGAGDGATTSRREVWGVGLLRYALFAGVIGVVFWMRYAVTGAVLLPVRPSMLDNPLAHVDAVERVRTALAVVAKYAGLLFWPGALSADYSYRAIPVAASWMDTRVIWGGIVGLVVLNEFVLGVRRRVAPVWGLAAALVAVPFLPVSNLLFPIGTPMAERLLYMPMVGFALAVGAGFERVPVRWDMWARGAVLALLAAYGVRSAVRNGDWRNDRTLFASAVRVVPESAKAQFNLGNALRDAGDDRGALVHYVHALQIDSQYVEAYYNLGVLRQDQGQDAGAIAAYRRALAADSLHVNARNNLGVLLARQGDYAGAAEAFARVGALAPEREDARFNLALAYEHLGRTADALAAYEALLSADPGYVDAALNASRMYRDQGDPADAVRVLRRTLAHKPDALRVALDLGMALEQAGDRDGAVNAFLRASKMNDRWGALALFAAGRLYGQMGKTEGAREALSAFLARGQGGDALIGQARRLLAQLSP